jgi:hypothetical protein
MAGGRKGAFTERWTGGDWRAAAEEMGEEKASSWDGWRIGKGIGEVLRAGTKDVLALDR